MFDLAGIFKGASDIIGKFKASPEEKNEAQRALIELQQKANQQVLDYELGLAKERASVLRAEAESNSWLAQSWRPITMLVIVACLVIMLLTNWGPDHMDHYADELIELVKLGLTGYIVGRSAEKIIPRTKWGKQ